MNVPNQIEKIVYFSAPIYGVDLRLAQPSPNMHSVDT